MKRTDWTVGNEGIRPAGKPDECFYCNQKLGEQHKPDCVIREQTVVVRLTLDLVMTFPEDWDANNIEFRLNDSTYCHDNTIEAINELVERINPDDDDNAPCVCNFFRTVRAEMIREATAEDEAAQKLFVADMPS